MLGRKTNKYLSKIDQKTALESTSQLESILEPTWLHFGMVLGSKMGPSSLQIFAKVDFQIDDKRDIISDRSWGGFCRIWGAHLGAKMEPKTPILEPRSAQDPQPWSEDGLKTSNLQPRIDFHRFWTSLWLIFYRF